MDFICFLCKKTFSESKKIVKHLKTQHLIQDKTTNINCLVNHISSNVCSNKYSNFRSLEFHMKECLQKKLKKKAVIEEVICVGLFGRSFEI